MGLLLEVTRASRSRSIADAGLLISGYALGGRRRRALLTVLTARLPAQGGAPRPDGDLHDRQRRLRAGAELRPPMAARVLTALAHGTFFGVGSVVATGLVPEARKASADRRHVHGPHRRQHRRRARSATWLGQHFGWRATFWAVARDRRRRVAIIAALGRAATPPPRRPIEERTCGRSAASRSARPRDDGAGYAGVFAVFTYIAPMLTRISGFSEAAVSPILLVFGGGLVVGNLVGGAPRRPQSRPRRVRDAREPRRRSGADGGRVRLARPRRRADRPPRGRRLRHRRAAPDVGAGAGRGRGEEPRLELQHRRLQSRQRHRRLGRRRRDRPRPRPRAAAGARRPVFPPPRSPSPPPRWASGGPQPPEIPLSPKGSSYGTSSARRSGLKVPVLSFGAGTFGGSGPLFGAWGTSDATEARRLVDICLEAGISLFDTADVYSAGASRRCSAPPSRAARRRPDLDQGEPADGRRPNEAARRGSASSRRRGVPAPAGYTDHIDLFQLHAFDAGTPVEEVLSTLDALVRAARSAMSACRTSPDGRS